MACLGAKQLVVTAATGMLSTAAVTIAATAPTIAFLSAFLGYIKALEALEKCLVDRGNSHDADSVHQEVGKLISDFERLKALVPGA